MLSRLKSRLGATTQVVAPAVSETNGPFGVASAASKPESGSWKLRATEFSLRRQASRICCDFQSPGVSLALAFRRCTIS